MGLKITELTELAATPATTDILVVVDDPGGSPVTKKITVANLLGGAVTAAANLTANALTVGDDGAKGVKALALGAANLKLFMNAAGTANEYAAGISIIAFTRVMSVASGDVAYTGAGFKPSGTILIATVNQGANIFSIGLAHSISENTISLVPRTVPIWLINAGVIIYIESDAADGSMVQYALAKSMDVDGMTATWTKVGLPTSTITGYILFFR